MSHRSIPPPRAAAFRGRGAKHPTGAGHPRSGGAWPPPREGDLGVELLLRGGHLNGGPHGDGGLPVLLREGLRLARGGLLPQAYFLLQA